MKKLILFSIFIFLVQMTSFSQESISLDLKNLDYNKLLVDLNKNTSALKNDANHYPDYYDYNFSINNNQLIIQYSSKTTSNYTYQSYVGFISKENNMKCDQTITVALNDIKSIDISAGGAQSIIRFVCKTNSVRFNQISLNNNFNNPLNLNDDFKNIVDFGGISRDFRSDFKIRLNDFISENEVNEMKNDFIAALH